MEPVGILLAAGSASRFGAPKLLHPLSDGTPVGVAAARALQQSLTQVIAVVRSDDRDLKAAFGHIGLQVVENPQAGEGMGTSVVAGLKATSDAAGWIFALADMPWVQASTIGKLADRLRQGARIVAPVHQGRRGNPVGFSGCWYRELSGLSGDTGARELLVRHTARVERIEVSDPGVLRDVDYPGDLRF